MQRQQPTSRLQRLASAFYTIRNSSTMANKHSLSSAGEEDVLFDDIPISNRKISEIKAIKNDDPEMEAFNLSWVNEARYFSAAAWEHLGHYVAKNKFLSEVRFSSCDVTDSKMRALFKGMTKSCSLKELDLSENEIGLDGIKAMVPFLKDCPQLSELDLDGNDELNTEGFELIVAALHGGPIERLRVERCNVGSIMALKRCTLPNLRNLDLGGNHLTTLPPLHKFSKLENLYLDSNDIAPAGFLAIAQLLQKEGSSLTLLSLCSTGMGDKEAEIIADSLKSNTELRALEMRGANYGISRRGLVAFLKLLNDISSIDKTLHSNHHLTSIGLPKFVRIEHPEMVRYMDFAINMNRYADGDSHRARRVKVIGSQLNRQKRTRLSHLQGLTHGSTHIFSQIESVILPNVLSLVGIKHGRDELLRTVMATSPYLMSLIDKKETVPMDIEE